MLWVFRVAVVLLLAAMLVVQVAILRKMPEPVPSVAAIQNAASPAATRDLLLRRPMVTVNGSVEVEGSVEAEIINFTPIEVEITNGPIEVEIVRRTSKKRSRSGY